MPLTSLIVDMSASSEISAHHDRSRNAFSFTARQVPRVDGGTGPDHDHPAVSLPGAPARREAIHDAPDGCPVSGCRELLNKAAQSAAAALPRILAMSIFFIGVIASKARFASRHQPQAHRSARARGLAGEPSDPRTKAEMGVADHVLESITGHLSRRMLEHYSHIRIDAKRQALDALDVQRGRVLPVSGQRQRR